MTAVADRGMHTQWFPRDGGRSKGWGTYYLPQRGKVGLFIWALKVSSVAICLQTPSSAYSKITRVRSLEWPRV